MENYNIVLAAGKREFFEDLFYPELGVFSIISGKPAIYWILKNFDNLEKTLVAISDGNSRLEFYLRNIFPEIRIVKVRESATILGSFSSSLSLIPDDASVTLLLSDTYLKGGVQCPIDTFLTSDNFLKSNSWCLVETDCNGNIIHFYDKERLDSIDDKKALVGCYRFSNVKLLKDSVEESVALGEKELSFAFQRYSKFIPLKALNTPNWIDLGHIGGLASARAEFLTTRTRFFNSIEYSSLRGTITKSSKNKEKLRNEYLWYKSLPSSLQVFAPRIFNLTESDSTLSLEMEMYPYSPLSDLWVYGDGGFEEWTKVLDRIFSLHREMRSYTDTSCTSDYSSIYIDKTKDRISQIEKGRLGSILKSSEISVNGICYRNYRSIRKELFNAIDLLLIKKNSHPSLIHGDLCFSNILFDPTFYILKFLDPRGSFGGPGIYGDPRYDIAKLRHSIVGLYDFIVAGFFKVDRINDASYTFEINRFVDNTRIGEYFDDLLTENSYDLIEIKLIEALLFLTMIPLHPESEARQIAFYLTAIKYINEIL